MEGSGRRWAGGRRGQAELRLQTFHSLLTLSGAGGRTEPDFWVLAPQLHWDLDRRALVLALQWLGGHSACWVTLRPSLLFLQPQVPYL